MAKTSLSDQAIFLMGAKTIDTITFIALGMVLTRLMNQTDYGTYQQVMLVVNTLTVFLPFGLSESIFYFYPKVENQKKFLLQTFLLLNLIGALGAVATLLFSQEVARFLSNTRLFHLALIYAYFVIFLTSYQILGPMLLSQGKGKYLAAFNSLFNLFFFASVALPIYSGWSLERTLLMVGVVYLARVGFVLMYILSMPGKIEGLLHWEKIKEQLIYAAPLGLSLLVGIFAKTIDRITISHYFTPAQYAIYDRGALQLPLVTILSYTVGGVLLPRYVEYYQNQQKGKLINLWHQSVRSVGLIMIPVFVLCFILAENIITFLYTDNYAQSTPVFKIYLLTLILMIPNFGSLLRATKYTKYIFYSSALAFGLGSLFSLILVRQMGTIGPAWGILITSVIVAGYYAHAARKAVEIEWSQLFPWKVLGQIGLISLLTGIICYPLAQLNLPKLATLTLVSLVYGGLYLGFLLTFRMLRVEDKAILKRWLTLQALRPQEKSDD